MAQKSKSLSATLLCFAALIVVSGALAASQLKGGSYKGSLIPSRDGVARQLQSVRQRQAGDEPEDQQHAALLQRRRPAHTGPLQERVHLQQRHVRKHRTSTLSRKAPRRARLARR